MTAAITTHLPLASAGTGAKRSRRSAPRGLPHWLWLLGVGVLPLGPPDTDGARAWVVSAGGGVAGVAAVVLETAEHSENTTRKDRP